MACGGNARGRFGAEYLAAGDFGFEGRGIAPLGGTRMSLDLSHLDSAVHPLASSDASDRIRMVSKDLFIEHEYSKHLNDMLDALLCEPRHGRMPCWLITGDAGMGKTAHLHRFARRYSDHRSEDNAALVRPIVIA